MPSQLEAIAEGIRDILLSTALTLTSDLRAWNMTLTARPTDQRGIEAAAREFLTIVKQRLPGGGALLFLDVGENGLWHIHAILIAPRGFPERVRGGGPKNYRRKEKNARARFRWWWTHLKSWGPRDQRPIGLRQYIYPLAAPLDGGLYTSLQRKLHHHLKEEWEQPVPLPPLGTRVLAVGLLEPIWRWVAAQHGVEGVAPPDRSPLPPAPRRPKLRHRRDGCCFRCFEKLDGRLRWHSRSCASAASRELRAAEKRAGPGVRNWVLFFEEELRFLRVDAVRLAESAIRQGLRSPKKEHLRLSRGILRCVCGEMIALNAKAVTCGSSTCRMHAKRRRERPEAETLNGEPETWPRRWRGVFEERLYYLGSTDEAVAKARDDTVRIFAWDRRREIEPGAAPPRLRGSSSWIRDVNEMIAVRSLLGR